MYCNLGGLKGWKIVLQYREVYCNGAVARLRNCIAGHQGVLQYRECRVLNCIAIGVQGGWEIVLLGFELYCNRCAVGSLYCNMGEVYYDLVHCF